MLGFLKGLLQEDAAESIDLMEGEEIIHVTGRHWIVLVVRLIVPILSISLFGGLAIYRAVGGGFLVTDTGQEIGLDLLNMVLIGAEVVLLLFWLALWVRRSKKEVQTRNIVLGVAGALLVLIYFRYQGGHLFYIDPAMFANQALDVWNIILIALASISFIAIFFTVYDWLNDELVVTNKRVIYDNDQVYIPRLLEQRRQEQIPIEEVQDVVARTKTYPQHWLQYGTVIVKSSRIGGQLEFGSAKDPLLMQKKIMSVVNTYRKTRSEKDFEQMIESRVYNSKPPKIPFKKDIKTTSAMRAVSWLVPENPEFNEDNGTYTWRAHWLFLLYALVGPLLLLGLGWLVVLMGARLGMLEVGWVALLMIAIFVAFLAYAAYQIEDYRNDLYILNPEKVIDIEKLPFGPEDRREAKIENITNTSFVTTFVSNLLGYGDVVLETAGGGGKFTFDNVPNPRDVVQKINDYQVMRKTGDKERALNDALTLLHHYHAAQIRHNELNAPPAGGSD